MKVVNLIAYLVQVNGSDLEPEDDDPQQTQDQRTVPVHHVLRTDQIHPNLTGKKVVGLCRAEDSLRLCGDNMNLHSDEFTCFIYSILRQNNVCNAVT